MMKKLLLLVGITAFSMSTGIAQTCTISSSANWDNASTPACQEGGSAGSASVIIIPSGVTVNFDGNGDTWTGTRIEVLGTLTINAPGQVFIYADITVKNGGVLRIESKLNIGNSTGCAYSLAIESGGAADITGGTPDRLSICGTEIARGGSAGCNNNYPSGSPPYCEPSGGFTGPTGFDEDGYNPTLPIKLSDFKVMRIDESIKLNWTTVMEENFEKFEVERSSNGREFEVIGELPGSGRNIEDIETNYSYTDNFPKLGFNYYRLKAIDYDRSYDFSSVRGINYEGEKTFSIHPNPITGNKISFVVNFSPAELDRITLTDLVGRELLNIAAAEVTKEIVFENKLSPGVYLVRYMSENFRYTRSLIVKH